MDQFSCSNDIYTDVKFSFQCKNASSLTSLYNSLKYTLKNHIYVGALLQQRTQGCHHHKGGYISNIFD